MLKLFTLVIYDTDEYMAAHMSFKKFIWMMGAGFVSRKYKHESHLTICSHMNYFNSCF